MNTSFQWKSRAAMTAVAFAALGLMFGSRAMSAVCVVQGVADPTAGLGPGFCKDKPGAAAIYSGVSYIDVVIDPQTSPDGTYDPADYGTWDIYVGWDSTALGTLTAVQPTSAPWPTTPATAPASPSSGNITAWCDPPALEENAFGPTCGIVDGNHVSLTNGSVGFAPNITDSYVVMRLLINPSTTGTAVISIGVYTHVFGYSGDVAPPSQPLTVTGPTWIIPPPQVSGVVLQTTPIDQTQSRITISWNPVPDAGFSRSYAVKKCSGASCTPSTVVCDRTTETSCQDIATPCNEALGYNVTGYYEMVPGSPSVTAYTEGICGEAPSFMEIESTTHPLADVDGIIEGRVDADTSLQTISVTAYICSGEPCADVAALNPVHPDSQGNFAVSVPGVYIKEDTPVRFALRAEDEFGFGFCYPGDVFDFAHCSVENLMNETNWTWTGGDNFWAPVEGSWGWAFPPTPSEYPFDPTDGDGINIEFQLGAASQVWAEIYTMNGRLIRTLRNLDSAPMPGVEGCYWNSGCFWMGTDERSVGGNRYVPSGLYIIRFRAVCYDCPASWTVRSLDYTRGIVIMK